MKKLLPSWTLLLSGLIVVILLGALIYFYGENDRNRLIYATRSLQRLYDAYQHYAGGADLPPGPVTLQTLVDGGYLAPRHAVDPIYKKTVIHSLPPSASADSTLIEFTDGHRRILFKKSGDVSVLKTR
jgi:hypothetical protein